MSRLHGHWPTAATLRSSISMIVTRLSSWGEAGSARRDWSYTRWSICATSHGRHRASATTTSAGATPQRSTSRRLAARAFGGFSTDGVSTWLYHTPFAARELHEH